MQSSRLAFAAVLVLFTLVGASLTSFATDHPAAGGTISAEKEGADSALTDRVETLLRSDIGLVGSRLRVQSRDGVVTVRGKVPDESAMRRALDLASGLLDFTERGAQALVVAQSFIGQAEFAGGSV